MNRERNLHGTNSYTADLNFDPFEFLLLQHGPSEPEPLRWLDLCCGRGRALIQAYKLFDAQDIAIEITGVDLVSMFDAFRSSDQSVTTLQLIVASLDQWCPPNEQRFDLITCVHGLHYLGDKLDLIRRAASWLKPRGRFVAHIDPANIRHSGNKDFTGTLLEFFDKANFKFDSDRHLLSGSTNTPFEIPWKYMGADDSAGPNFTGQPAVNSWYADHGSECTRLNSADELHRK